MMEAFKLKNSSAVLLTSAPLGSIDPGDFEYKQYLVNNALAVAKNAKVAFFPGIKNNSIPGGKVFGQVSMVDYTGELNTTTVSETSSDGLCTKRTTRDPVFLEAADGSFTDYTAGDVSFPASADETLYIGCEFPARNIKLEFDTPGSYTGLTFKYWNGAAWTALPTGWTDGTSGTTADGNLYLGPLTKALEVRKSINGKSAYYIQVTCSTVATQAIADVLYPDFIYELTKKCLSGNGLYYSKSSGGSYTAAAPYLELANNGMIIYDADPLTSDVEIRAAFSYKNPQTGSYVISFASNVSCTVDGGSAVTIVCDGQTVNKNVIEGMDLVFASTVTGGDEATVVISDMAQYIWYALDSTGAPGTWQNKDIDLGEIAASSDKAVWIGFEFPSSLTTSDNGRYCEYFIDGGN